MTKINLAVCSPENKFVIVYAYNRATFAHYSSLLFFILFVSGSRIHNLFFLSSPEMSQTFLSTNSRSKVSRRLPSSTGRMAGRSPACRGVHAFV